MGIIHAASYSSPEQAQFYVVLLVEGAIITIGTCSEGDVLPVLLSPVLGSVTDSDDSELPALALGEIEVGGGGSHTQSSYKPHG